MFDLKLTRITYTIIILLNKMTSKDVIVHRYNRKHRASSTSKKGKICLI